MNHNITSIIYKVFSVQIFILGLIIYFGIHYSTDRMLSVVNPSESNIISESSVLKTSDDEYIVDGKELLFLIKNQEITTDISVDEISIHSSYKVCFDTIVMGNTQKVKIILVEVK